MCIGRLDTVMKNGKIQDLNSNISMCNCPKSITHIYTYIRMYTKLEKA